MAEEFTSIDIFHLRGNQRTQGEESRREGGKVFGQGSRAPIAKTVLTLNPADDDRGKIRFHDIGDYLTAGEKLAKVASFQSLSGITNADGWKMIVPNNDADWLNQRDPTFDKYPQMRGHAGIFSDDSNGVMTSRDAWVISPSRRSAVSNVTRMISFYEEERKRLQSVKSSFETARERDEFVSKVCNK